MDSKKEYSPRTWQVGSGTTNHYDGLSGLVFSSLFGFTPVKAPNGLRQVPDVSAAAYPNIAIYYQGAWLAVGGTSAAAPIWAAGALLTARFFLVKFGSAIFIVPPVVVSH